MLTRVRGITGTATVVIVLMFGAGEPAVAQPPEPATESASAPAARQLVQALEGAQLDSIAAKDSEGDDRFVAAYDRDPSQSAFFTVAYTVRAVSPGTYVHPGATVEDMYRPARFGRTASGSVTVGAAK